MQFCDHLNYRGSHTRELWENITARSSSQSILSNRLSLKYYIMKSILYIFNIPALYLMMSYGEGVGSLGPRRPTFRSIRYLSKGLNLWSQNQSE